MASAVAMTFAPDPLAFCKLFKKRDNLPRPPAEYPPARLGDMAMTGTARKARSERAPGRPRDTGYLSGVYRPGLIEA
jgi:hypothetical protein